MTERAARALDRLALVAAVIPLLAAGVRALAGDWYPMGDNAFFGLRAVDVFTSHHPLLGTGSSVSVTSGVEVNNPGPLHFDWLALPAKVEPAAGLVVGSVLLNVVAVVGIVVVCRRIGGARLGALGATMASALGWSLGSALLVEPWQPHSMLLPALFYLVLVWALVRGQEGMLPWAAGVASLLVQTHLIFIILVPGLALVALAARATRAGRRRRQVLRRPLVVSAVVLAVAWLQPLVDQVGGRGNLGNLMGSAGSGGGMPIGASFATRMVSGVVTGPAWWARGGFAGTFKLRSDQAPGTPTTSDVLGGVPSLSRAVVGLAAVAVLGLIGGRSARRRGDRDALAGLMVMAAAVVLSIITVAVVPVGPLGISPHQFRFLWPVSVLVSGVLVLALLGDNRRWTPMLVATTVALAALNLPSHHKGIGPDADAPNIPVARALFAQLDDLDRSERYLVDAEGSRLFDPFTTPLLLELQRRGIPFTIDHEFTLAQVGESRREDGQATVELYVVEGPGARDVPPGERQVARVDGLDLDEREELARDTAAVRALLQREGLVVTPEGRRALETGQLPVLDGVGLEAVDLSPVLDSGELARMVRKGFVEAHGGPAVLLERWAALDQRDRRDTVAVNAAPIHR